MIFEGAFDDLVEKIWGNELVNVSTRKAICERLLNQ